MANRKTNTKKPKFSWEEGYEPVREFTLAEARAYLKSKGKTSGRFYYNVSGWDTYYTLEPTHATPTGKLKGFPRTQIITVQGMGSVRSDKLDLTKTVDASKLQARLFSILREFQRTAPDNFTQVRAWARKKAKENFIMPTNKVALISDHLALFLLGDKNNEFSKQLML